LLWDFAEEIGIASRYGDVAQRAYTPCRIDAYSHQKADARIRDFLECNVHLQLIIAIISRGNQPLCCIRPNYKGSRREQAVLFDEGGCSRKFDWRVPGELRQPLSDRCVRQGRFVDISDRDFERQGLLPELFRDPCQQHMSSMHGVERTWQ